MLDLLIGELKYTFLSNIVIADRLDSYFAFVFHKFYVNKLNNYTVILMETCGTSNL